MKNNSDVIVIGSGIGGLTSAALLAKNGYKVHIYERLNQPGGYVNTFKRGGYWFEATTHQLVGFENKLFLKNEIKQLGLKLDFIKLTDSFESILFNEKYNIIKRFNIESGFNNAYKSLSKYFPVENKNISDFFIRCKNICKESFILRKIQNKKRGVNFIDLLMALILKKKNILPFIKKLGFNYYKNFLNFRNESYNKLLIDIASKELKFLLCLYCYYFIQAAPSKYSAMTMSHIIYNLILTPPLFLKGGTKKLLEKCINIIKNNSGDLYYKSCVKKVILKRNKAVGIELENGEKKYAEIIISNSDVYLTYNKLINKYTYNDNISEKLKKYKSTNSAFQIYIGLPYMLEEFGFNTSTIFFNSINDIDKLLNSNFDDMEKSSFALTNYTAMDPDFSPLNKSSLMITEFDSGYDFWCNLSREQYKKEKKKKQDNILKKIQKISGIPFNKSEIIFSATPLTMERYSGRKRGAVYGVEKSMNDYSKFENKSCINNLYLVGADTGNSGSITSVFYSGIKTAEYIIKHK